MGLVLKWIEQSGGVMGMAKKCVQKSQLIYTTIQNSDGFYRYIYTCPNLQTVM